jgi:hypothetical protein
MQVVAASTFPLHELDSRAASTHARPHYYLCLCNDLQMGLSSETLEVSKFSAAERSGTLALRRLGA